uniref:Uncharacterized protein n=1 Tax=Salinispora arenicola (strain CNS-205) TaxID=391037 RepID=A8M354_SALAI
MTAARWLALGVPLLAVLAAAQLERDRRARAAALLAAVAAALGVAALNESARRTGWYAFAPVHGAYRGIPVDLWLGWAALWGALPVLLRRFLPLPLALGLLLWLDVVAMPALHPLVLLGPHWLVGEVVGLLAVALPAQLLGRWSADGRHLRARVLLQVVVFATLLLWLVPSIAFELGGGSWSPLTGLPSWSWPKSRCWWPPRRSSRYASSPDGAAEPRTRGIRRPGLSAPGPTRIWRTRCRSAGLPCSC